MKKGLLILYTGNGKGKTTAALGQALRAAGHGQKVCIVQFVKKMQETGEAKAIRGALAEAIELHITGSGFTWDAEDQDELKQAAASGWELAKEKIVSDNYDMLILDELTYLLNYGLLDRAEVLSCINKRPERLNIVITGRDAGQELIAAADLVTAMQELKHPFKEGIKARKGIEF